MIRSPIPLFVAAVALVGSAERAWAADCYVDSNNGKDSNDGKSATTPVQTQKAIPSGCTTVRFARGSVFQEQLRIVTGVKTYTNYTPPDGSDTSPLPDFKYVTAPVVSAMQGGITLDGLKLEGSHNQGGSLSSLQSGGGICVYVGNNTTVQNCEVTDCDFAIFFAGAGGGSNTKSLATHNYVHDILGEAVDGSVGSDPNAVGGSKGIYVMTDNVEVSYNTIVNCVNYPQWTGASGSTKGGCDGGATEIAAASGGSVKGYRNHHNFAYNTCGFFQASTFFSNNSGTAAQTGTFEDSEFAYNVMIDTAWMILAQVNNMSFVNMRWYNNTVVQHANSAGPVGDQGMLMEMWNGTSSGVSTGGVTPANQIFMTNNLMVLYGVNDSYDFNANWTGGSMSANTPIVRKTNIFLNNTKLDPGFVKLGDGKTVPSATDFDLTSDTTDLGASNPTIAGGTAIDGQTLDFLNRAVPSGGKVDIGAFQFGSTASDAGTSGGSGGSAGSAGSPTGSGGATSTSTSTSTSTGKGGVAGSGSTKDGGAGGISGSGGKQTGAGGSGSGGTSGASSASSGTGGSEQGQGGAPSSVGSGGGGTSAGSTTASAGASKSGCGCALGRRPGGGAGLWLLSLGLATADAFRRRRGHGRR